MKYDEKQLDEMLKKHLLPKSKFEEIISNQSKSRDEYILWALKNDSPRGVGITWEKTETKIIEYEKKLSSEGYKYSYNSLKEVDPIEIEDKKLATKFECREVKLKKEKKVDT